MAPDEERPDDVNAEGGNDGERSDDDQGAADAAAEPDAQAPDSGDDGDELTLEDILGAEQTPDAADADRPAGTDDAEGPSAPEAGGESSHLDDLRRLTAEYANYRKRTEANMELERNRAKAAAAAALLPVVDDLDRAEQHGDLEEGSAFATIAQKIRGVLERMGLEGFGEKGEPFDPQVHEAIAQVPVPGTESPTVLDVIERGYRIGDVELRPAKVAVAVGADG